MKKLISLLAALAVVATGTVAFAADPIDVSGATAIEKPEDGVYNITATTTADQATILAIKGTTVQVGAIQYINQATTTAVEDSETDKTATFTFSLNDELLASEEATAIADTKVYVLTGGDGTTKVVGYIETATAATPETFKVYGFVADTEATVYLGDLSVDVDSTGAYAFEKLAADAYELIIKAPGAFDKTIDVTVTDADVLVADAENATVLKYGVLQEGGTKVELKDLSILLGAYGTETGAEAYLIACDFDRSGKVELKDLSILLGNYGKSIDEVYAE